MKGKKTMMFSCRCCDAVNFKEMLAKREAEKIIRKALRGIIDE